MSFITMADRFRRLPRALPPPFPIIIREPTGPPEPICISSVALPVDFFVADEGAENIARAFEAVLNMADDKQTYYSAYASAICMIMPELTADLKRIMRTNGFEAVDVSLPPDEVGPTAAAAPFSWPKMLAIFGAGVLLIFEEVRAHNFEEVMDERLGALKSAVGADDDELIENPFSLMQAKDARTSFGADIELKKKMVKKFLRCSNKDDEFGRCCLYLTRELAWCDMRPFKDMYDALFVARSPIIYDRMMAAEVMSVNEALDKINECRHPPYFMLLSTHVEQYALERCHFPVLLKLASLIKKEESVGRLVRPVSPEIRRLLDMHKSAMDKKIVPKRKRAKKN